MCNIHGDDMANVDLKPVVVSPLGMMGAIAEMKTVMAHMDKTMTELMLVATDINRNSAGILAELKKLR